MPKLKPLLDTWQPHMVATSEWLGARGITPQDVRNYVGSKWLVSLGRGAFKRPSETVTWQGALYSIQKQLGLPVHIGALTALEMTGHQHYLRLGGSKVYLFSEPNALLPKWFRAHWGDKVRHIQTKLLPAQMAMTTKETPEGLPLACASPERAILEALHLAPKHFDLVELALIIEGMVNLRPKVMQELLEVCASIKVKRLFLYLAERAGLRVIQHLDLSRIKIGTGKRAISESGRLTSRYGLLLPEELVADGN